jgi:hypothetical protein
MVHPADHAIDTVMRSLACAKLPKAVDCSMKNPPQLDDGQRHEWCIFCRAEKVRKVTEDGRDYFECAECGRRAKRRIMLDPEMSGFRCAT